MYNLSLVVKNENFTDNYGVMCPKKLRRT